MALTAHNLITKRDIIAELQYVTEGNSVTTPSLFGVTPTASPVFALVNNTTDIELNPDVRHMDIDVLGTEDFIDAVKTEELHAVTIKNNPSDLLLWKYVWNPVGQTLGPDSSLSFFYSYAMGGTEYYQFIKGCRPVSGTLKTSRGLWEQEITFVAQDITVPAVVTTPYTSIGLTTPTIRTAETTVAPLVHTTGGTTPFLVGATNYAERSFSVTVTRGLAIEACNGLSTILFSKPSTRRITYQVDIFAGSNTNVLATAYDAKTNLATNSYSVVGAADLTFTNSVITDFKEVHAAGTSDALIDRVTFRSESVTPLA